MGIEIEHITAYNHAKKVFEWAHSKGMVDVNYIVADFEKIIKKHFKEIDKAMLDEILALPFKYYKRLALEHASKKRVDTIELSENKEPKPLHLVLQRVYFNQILAGTKKSEYREEKPFYNSRFMRDGKYRNFSHVDFQEGYQKGARRMKVEIKKIELSNNMYKIYLGRIVEKSF